MEIAEFKYPNRELSKLIKLLNKKSRFNPMKVAEYSAVNLSYLVGLLDSRVYLLFYDLDYSDFYLVTDRFKKYMNVTEANVIESNKIECLQIVGYFYKQKEKELTAELDCMDIDEFDIAEYPNEQEDIRTADMQNATAESGIRKIYVNKPEATIQLYNF